MSTQQEQNSLDLIKGFLDLIEGFEKQDLVAMIKEWIFFGELPETTISQIIKRQQINQAQQPQPLNALLMNNEDD